MIRNRIPRFRNLQNLHVIPTASNELVNTELTSSKPESPPANSPPLTAKPLTVTEPPVAEQLVIEPQTLSNKSTEKNMFSQKKARNKIKGQINKGKRKRSGKHFASTRNQIQNSSYQWYYPSYINETCPEKIEEVESISEVPIEEDFEEVEVASVDADGKQEVLVGFRASKIQYLKNYKKNCFFKPKIYKFSCQRTFVNCLNVQDNFSVDVDVISEAEYEIEYETDNLDQTDIDQNKVVEVKSTENEPAITNNKENLQLEGNKKLEINKVEESTQRIYKTCIEDTADICQGQSLIQSSLDTWKSHLIGLEYLIEIQKKSKGSSAKYYCVLCSEDLQVEEDPAVNVINHINGYKHTVSYLEKHFPSSGLKFSENSEYNIFVLQKMCEEINRKLGYAFMCITNLHFYEKNEQKIKEIVQNASHPSEKNLKLDKTAFQNVVESELAKDVRNVVDSVIKKVAALEETLISECGSSPREMEKEMNSQISSNLERVPVEEVAKTSVMKESVAKNSKSPKSFLKYKGSSAISSYLKLKYAKFKGSKSVKGPIAENVSSNDKKLIAGKTPILKSTKSEKTVNSEASKNILGNKEKVVQKPTVHSKHCRKRILGRENSRLRVVAKASAKDEIVSDVFNKSSVKYVSVSESQNRSASKKILSDKNQRYSETMIITSHKSSPLRKVTSIPVKKVSRLDSKAPITKYSKSPHRRVVLKKEIENSKHDMNETMVRDSSSHWKPIIRPSRNSVKSPSENSLHLLKSMTRKHSRSPLRRSPIKRNIRRLSKSPMRKTRSPIRQVIRSPIRRFSRSTIRKHSRSPVRRKSSPYRKPSKSPPRRSPFRKPSKSPLRRKSRSPYWKQSRSPFRKRSRSPVRRRSRSPMRHRSRSPLRRQSRSPIRRRSRSPLRRHSKSPIRRHSKSPIRRHSKSPVRRQSRSPMRRQSRSPFRWHSRSPVRRYSRSPVKRYRSPVRRHSKGSVQSLSKSPAKEYRNIYKAHSPNIRHSSSIDDHIISKDRFAIDVYNYDERMARQERELTKIRGDKHKVHIFAPGSMRGISDLDPVSDEDESVYFDKQQHAEDILNSSSKMMIAQLFKKISIPNMNPDDPSLNKLMQFMEAHSSEIQDLMGSQSIPKPGKMNINKTDSKNNERSLFLQQYLLSNLAGSSQEPGLSAAAVAGMQPKYQQPPFLSENIHAVRGLTPNITPHPHNLLQPNAPRFFPPNINVPPPEPYHQFNQPLHDFSKSQVPPEVVFKDLKATVSKLFGANENAPKQEKIKSIVPGYVTVPDPEKWDLSHPDTQKFNVTTGPRFSGPSGPRFNAPIGQKNVFHSQGKNINFTGAPECSVTKAEMPIMYNNSNNAPGHYFSGRSIDRPPVQNVTIPPPDAKVSFCDVPRGSSKGNLFPVVHNVQVNSNFSTSGSHGVVSDVKVSLAQRLASVLVKVGMTDVPAPLLQEMLMKIGAFSSLPRQDISEAEIISILKRLGYLS